MKILLGSDPELFVFKNGEPISAHGMVDGDKYNPLAVEDGAVQVDGMALEYNTNPADTLDAWEHNHSSVQKQLSAMIGKDLTLEAKPTAFFSEEVFNSTPKEALVLGCEPDFNAYTGRANPKPNGEVKFRTGAGHIHIGWGEGFDIKDPFHLGECHALVKMLDLHLGIPSILMDGDFKRRELYGRAGAFRPKSYGLEYRTLSNFWVATEKGRKWAYESTNRAVERACNPDARYGGGIQNTINTNNINKARVLVNIYGLNMEEV